MAAETRVEPQPKDLAALQERVGAGWQPKFVFFWSHEPKRHGGLGSECFSQWFRAPFSVDGHEFSTAEHYMMWRKAMLFGDGESADLILGASNPAAAKRFGRGVRHFDDDTWNERRFAVVVDGTRAKFAQNADLRAYLVGTGSRVLVEASPNDSIWGIGLDASDPRAMSPQRWRGLNLLGFALMQVRSELTLA